MLRILEFSCDNDFIEAHNFQCLKIQQQYGKLNDLVNVVRRVFPFAGGLKVEEAEVVQVVGVGVQGTKEVARGGGVLE